MTDICTTILDGIRVLDLTENRGEFAGKFLADLGADVIKVERPQGCYSRSIGPFKNDAPGVENSLHFLHFNTGKRGITLDLNSPFGKDIFCRTIKLTDVVIEDFEPDKMKSLGLDYQAIQKQNTQLIFASITGFGQNGPYRQYKAPDIVSFATGGLMFTSGASDEAPVVAPCEQAFHGASIMAAFGILSALLQRKKTGKGQTVSVSAHETIAIFSQAVMRYSVTSGIGGRTGSQFPAAPARIYPCQDGYVHPLVFYVNHWRSFRELLGNPDIFMDKAWDDAVFRVKNVDLIDPYVNSFFMSRTKAEITELCQAKGIPCTPVNTPADNYQDSHLIARGFFKELEHPVIGTYAYPGAPFKFSETPYSVTRSAPLLGQHNREFYLEEMGLVEEDLEKLQTQGVI
jgi:crotonobetainyl-CoA:carnitine CoA-transferase CaiB-like acyl-CoA transferase